MKLGRIPYRGPRAIHGPERLLTSITWRAPRRLPMIAQPIDGERWVVRLDCGHDVTITHGRPMLMGFEPWITCYWCATWINNDTGQEFASWPELVEAAR